MAGLNTKRRPVQHPMKAQITAEIVGQWKAVRQILAAGDDQFWEDEGGRRGEFHAAVMAIHRHFKLSICGVNPDQTIGVDAVPEGYDDKPWFGWERARELRLALDAALGHESP
jgi:hypothetical protein